jgi:sugar lactone lactonase YvrE
MHGKTPAFLPLRIVSLLAALAASCATGTSPPPATGDHLVAGFDVPESVLHDDQADVYLVSNIAGSPFDKDGRGFVSRVTPDGRLVERQWIQGLNAPKGMALAGSLLVVADIDVLRRFDRTSGRAHDVVAVPGATFLNDVAAAPDGTVFASDSGMAPGDGQTPGATGSDAIYRLDPGGAVTAIARGRALAMPNGLVAADGALYMVPFGADTLVRFAPDGRVLGTTKLPAGQLDGVVAVPAAPGRSCLLIASFGAPGILAGPPEGPFTTAAAGVLGADIGVDVGRGRLLIPLITDNRLRIAPLATFTRACAAP